MTTGNASSICYLIYSLNPFRDISKSPSYWSMVCLCNIAKLAKESTTVRRVLEPLLTAFDSGDYWFPQKGVASSVLLFLQSRLEESGQMIYLVCYLS